MKKRLLFWTAALLVAIGGVQQAKAYGTNDLTDAGWQPVTSLSSVSDYFYVIVDNSQDYFVSLNGTQVHYKAAADPLADFSVVWALETNGTSFGIRNIGNYKLLVQTEADTGWNLDLNDQPNVCAWTNFNFKYENDGYWTIENGQYPYESEAASDVAPYKGYWGPWNGRENFSNLRIAGNKNLEKRGYFQIYQISRADFVNAWLTANQARPADISFLYTGLTNSTTAWTNSYTDFTGNYQAQNATNKDIEGGYTNRGYLESWNAGNVFSGTLTTRLNNLPDGIYDMGAYCFKDATNEVYFTSGDASTQLNNDNALYQYAENHVTVDYEGAEANKKTIGLNITSGTWIGITDIRLKYYGPVKISDVAIALPEGGAMEANKWYYFDVSSDDTYSFTTTTSADIIFTADGTLPQREADTQAVALPSGNQELTAGRYYYIKSSSANNFALTLSPKANATDMEQLAAAIASAKGDHALGFDSGDYAPYNNVANLQAIAEAEAIDQNNPSNYTASAIQTMVSGLQNATWTANTSEVNGIFWKTDYVAADIQSDTYIHPIGWTNTGYNTRVYCSNAGNLGTNNGLSAVDGTAIMSKYNTSYGEATGYTIPLKANTYYKISFKYCGWGNNPTTNVVLTGPNGFTVTPASFRPETSDGYSNASDWYTYTATFKTGADEGNYTLALNKVETGQQQQIGWGDMVLVRATAEDLTYTLETGAMNAGVAAAQQTAADTFVADKTFEKYEALLTAIEAAKTSEAEYVLINNRINLLKAQLGDIPVADAEADAFVTNYANGVYENLGQVIPAYQTFVQNYWATNTPGENADLTAFIINPSLDFGNATGWSGGGVNNGTIEWFNGNYNVFQTLTGLHTGTYKLQAQGYYRPGDNENASTAQNALLYGGDFTKPVALIASEGKEAADVDNGYTTANTNRGSAVYVPDSQADAAKAFASGAYENEVTFVVSNGTVNIGFKKDVLIANDWTCFDNFKLIYESEDALVAPEMPTEQMYAGAKAEMQAALATWTANKSTDNYNALVEKINAANQSVELYKQIKARLDLLTSAGQRGSISEEAEKAMSFYTKYSDGMVNETADATTGTYTSLDEVVTEYQANIAAYWTANAPAADDDLTSLITNNSFEFGNLDTWAHYNGGDSDARENANGTYTIDIADGNYVANFWNNNADVKYIFKDIALPNGTYELKAIFASDEGVTINFTAESGIGADNRIGEVRNTFTTEAAKGVGAEKTLEVVVHNGTLRLGANTTSWFKVDNFRLIFKNANATVAPALVNDPMNKDIRQAQSDAYDAWDADKTVANYNALLDAIADAQESADKYVIINNRIPKLADQSDGIDVTALTTKYNDGDYVEADDVFKAYRDIIATYYETNAPADNTDLTEFIINPSFEFGDTDGWALNPSNDTGVKSTDSESSYRMTNSDGDWLFNTWSNNNAFLYIVQELTGLPQGTYELTAVFATYNDYTIEFTAENVQPDGINEKKLTFMPKDISGQYGPETGLVKTIRFMVSDGTLKIGAHANGFFKCDNFQLKFISTAIDAVDTNQPMNRYERENYLKAITAYNTESSPENLRELIDRKLIVENSIEAYKAAQATLERVKAMMSKTNVYTYEAYFTIDDMYRKYGNDPVNGVKGLVYYETLEDDVAFDLERMFFGAGHYRNYVDPFSNPPVLTWMGDIPAVPFIASAWDCGYDGYAYRYKEELTKEDGTHWKEGDDYYANTWSTEGIDDGTNMLNPYLEYWLYGDQLLAPKTMTATVEGTPGKEYSVKMFVRVRTIEDNQTPTGMSIQIGNGTPVVPEWQYVDNSSSYYVLNNMYRLWVCNLWDYAEGDLPKGFVDQDGKLRIKFIMEPGETNITWLSFKDVYVNYDGEDLSGILAQLKTEVNYANTNFYVHLGFDEGEYAPYTNVEELIALKRAQQVYDASENYFLVKAAYEDLYAYNHGGENGEGTWTKNPEEMNGFYWTNDYTKADVQHVEWYGEEDDCITPKGWELIGRNDGFSTGIKKLGVNTDDECMKAIEGETGLLTKYETDYGKETGYTLPLKAGVKYILTFTCAYLGEGTFPTTISMSATTGATEVLREPLTITEIQPVKPTGEKKQGNWYMYRATFVPEFDADYVITFDKNNVDSEPVMMGELTLVRYQDDVDVINGESKDFTYEYEPEFIGTNATVTRSFNAGAYNTLVLPFKLSGNELKDALGENFDGKVYYYTGVGTTSGESRDYYQLKFEERESGIFANVPVLFYSDASNPVNNWGNKNFTNMVTRYVKNDLTVDTDVFDFVGTYKTQKVPEGGWYIKADNNFYKSSGKANIQPTRGYFIPYNTDGDVILHAKIMGFDIDDEPTGIMAIEEDGSMHVTSGNIYTLDGRLVRQNAKTLEGLPRGTYIVDGKKYMIK